MSSTARVAKSHAPEILFGSGALPEAAVAAMGLGARSPLVVTDPWLERTPWPGTVLDGLRDRGATPVVWSDVQPNPRAAQILAGADAYHAFGCDVIVAVGGGSVIDAAKGIALVVSNGGHILEYEGIDTSSSWAMEWAASSSPSAPCPGWPMLASSAARCSS